MTHEQPTRRTFMKAAGTVAAFGSLAAAPLVRAVSPNGQLNHASIGVGGMGWGDLDNFLQHAKVRIAAICDVDAGHLARAAERAKDANKYIDWRELLDKEGDKIDSVNVTVPDHMHAIITIAALERKKSVYCQKPLCHDVAEVRAVTLAAQKAGVYSQLGTQHASGIGDRMGVQFMKDRHIGKLKRLILCSNRPGAIEGYRLRGPRPAQTEKAPDSLAWDLWLGTAPERGFSSRIYHPTLWRAWQDFGTGWSGDIGCHIFDAPWKGYGLTAPKSVRAEVQGSWRTDPDRRRDNWPQSDHITWVFPGNDMTEGDELIVEWFDGMFYPPAEVQALYESGDTYPGESCMAIGTDGALLLPHGGGPQLLPKEKFQSVERPKLPGRNHYHHFVDAILGGEKNESHFAQTGPMTEAILLGTVAIRVPDTTLEWDAKNLKITNNAEANKYLRRQYRAGWGVPGV